MISNKNILLLLQSITLIFILGSCSVNDYYQLYTTSVPEENLKNDEIVFMHDKCIVKYQFHNNGENISLAFYNLSDNLITIDLTKSFFVLNGKANSYFQNRSISRQFASTLSVTENYQYYNFLSNISKISGSNTSGISVTYHELPQITIPPRAFIELSEFAISKIPYVSCSLEKYPNPRKISSLKYDRDNSPFVFSNFISYYSNRDTQTINHDFYIEEIVNYPQDKLLITRDTNNCGKSLGYQVYTLKKIKPNQFYIKYQRQ
jgi:hypothetical protein